MNNMTTRYRLTTRGSRGGTFYCVDKTTRKRTSLKTTDADEAHQIVAAKNQAERQPVLNLQIAKAYLAGSDNGVATRTPITHTGIAPPPSETEEIARGGHDIPT